MPKSTPKNKPPKNKPSTLSYFVKRLRDRGYYVNKIFTTYNKSGRRRWTVMINPSKDACYVTYYSDGEGGSYFRFQDGGQKYPEIGYNLDTMSMETIIANLQKRLVLGNETSQKHS